MQTLNDFVKYGTLTVPKNRTQLQETTFVGGFETSIKDFLAECEKEGKALEEKTEEFYSKDGKSKVISKTRMGCEAFMADKKIDPKSVNVIKIAGGYAIQKKL